MILFPGHMYVLLFVYLFFLEQSFTRKSGKNCFWKLRRNALGSKIDGNKADILNIFIPSDIIFRLKYGSQKQKYPFLYSRIFSIEAKRKKEKKAAKSNREKKTRKKRNKKYSRNSEIRSLMSKIYERHKKKPLI